MRSRATLPAAWAALMIASAQAQNSSPCQSAPSPAVKESRAQLERDPAGLEARFRLADALTQQQCYDEAVQVLEAGAALHRQNAALEARLRNARSMMSEQRYIEGVTRAEESARLQRNVLRCKRLGDVAACDEALILRRSDWELLIAKGDALALQNRSADALAAYRHAAELNPGHAALQSAIARLEAARTVRAAPPAAPPRVAATIKPKAAVYSNEAPAGRTN